MDQLLTGDEHPQFADEREALRRVATLVTAGAEPAEIFTSVVNEMRRCAHASNAGLWRFEGSGEITLLAGAAEPAELAKWAVGTSTPVDGNTLAAAVYRTRQPARVDTYKNVSGSIAAHVRDIGVRSAVGVPVIVDGHVWGLAAVGTAQPDPMPANTEARIAVFAELIASAIVAGYRDEQKRRLLADDARRPSLMDSLLYGRILDQWSAWEIANQLRLPTHGPFVVITADTPAVGEVALPEIEPKLRSLDVYSAWRMLPDLQIGIIHVKSDPQLDKVLALVSRIANHRVGVSNRFDDLSDVPLGFHVAKVTLRSRACGDSLVAVFDGTILGTAAICAPEVMLKSVGTVLDAFDDLGEEERELLFETFRVWQDSDASVRATAEVLICHPNTVRYRLRRIEQRTGRSLSRPRDIAELCLAFEVQRRLL